MFLRLQNELSVELFLIGKQSVVGSTWFYIFLSVCGSAGQGKVEVSCTVTPSDRTGRVGGDFKPEAAPRTRGSGPNPTSPKPPPQGTKPSPGPRPALPQKPRSSSTRSIGTHSLLRLERNVEFCLCVCEGVGITHMSTLTVVLLQTRARSLL